MNRWTVTSLTILTIGVAGMLLAQQIGSCVIADSRTGNCIWNWTMILGLGGGILILFGLTGFLASTWPGPMIRNWFTRFLAVWAIVAIAGSAWAWFMLLDWNFVPSCPPIELCSNWPDIAPAAQLFTLIGFGAATLATVVISASGWGRQADTTP